MSTAAVSLPAAGTWDIETAHTTLGFVARHLLVTKVRGHFKTFTASVVVGDSPETSSVEATIDAASITTSDDRRDEHLRSADFFEVDKHPTLQFRSTSVKSIDETHFEVAGDLTIRGISNPVLLSAEYLGINRNPWGKDVAAFTAKGEIDREEFGLTWNQALESGGVLVGRKIVLEIEAQAILRDGTPS